jgi:Uma2 family endonuclease
MSLPQRKIHYTDAEFAALAKVSDRRLELWDGEVFDMSYTSPNHRDLVDNLFNLLRAKLSSPCAPRIGEPIRPPKTSGVYREPDLTVLCGPRRIETHNGLELTTNPVVIIEVASPETESFDRGGKLIEYQAIASLREYLIVSQRSASVTQWTRRGEAWRESATIGLPSTVTLHLAKKVTLAMRDIYRGVQLT